MLRRPPTQISLTLDDIAAYELARQARQAEEDARAESIPSDGSVTILTCW